MLERKFPSLAGTPYRVTSPASREYNCIAYAARDNTRFWWPHEQAYWPEGLPKEETIEAMVLAFESLGYERSNSVDREEGKEKVAIYADGDSPKHAARQLHSGLWTSKLGSSVDIAHTLEGLEGTEYGRAVCILERARP